MKYSRSTSTHLTNLSFRSNNNITTINTIQSPQSVSKLSEVNSKIDDLLKKSQTNLFQNTQKNIQHETKIAITNNYTLTLEQIQKEKKQLLTLLLQKDSIIREQQNKLTQLDLQNKSLQRQIQSLTNIKQIFQECEQECSKLKKNNEELKYEKNQISTSLNFLKCQNLQIVSNEIKVSLEQLNRQIKKYYFYENDRNDYYNLELTRPAMKIHEFDYYCVLRDCLDIIQFMIRNTDDQFDTVKNLLTKK